MRNGQIQKTSEQWISFQSLFDKERGMRIFGSHRLLSEVHRKLCQDSATANRFNKEVFTLQSELDRGM